MNQKINFHRLIKEKEITWERAKSYWKYIITFCALQFLDMLLSDEGVQWTPFLTIEMIVFGGIGIVLFIMHAYYFLRCKYRNREVQYAQILKKYFIDEKLQEYSNFGVAWRQTMTLAAHSEMNRVRKEDGVFWGWGDDGVLIVCEDEASEESYINGYSLYECPWTCTEQKNVSLSVKPPVLEEKLTEDMLREQFDVCMKQEKILYANQLYLYPLYLDENGRALQLEAYVMEPLLLKKEYLSEKNGIEYQVFSKCVEQLQKLCGNTMEQWKPLRYGIVSLFQQVEVRENSLSQIGLLAFIQLDTTIVRWIEEQKLITARYEKESEVVSVLLDNSQNEVMQYALLMYAFAKLKRYEFVELFLQEVSRVEKHLQRKTQIEKEQHVIYSGNARESFSSLVKLRVRRLLYQLSNFIVSSPWKKILFLIVFALENIIEPFTVGSAKVSLNWQSIWKALVLDHIETILLLLAVGALWLLLLYIFSLQCVKNRLNPSLRMLQTLTTTGREKYIQIGKNTNLFWADNLIEGWNEDKITICVAHAEYKATEELLQYENDKIKKEMDDGTKFRMISVTEDYETEKIEILVDRCKYTETMRVQEMLRQYRAAGAHEAYYNRLRAALINLKERSEIICLEDIPPNSLCMHAVILTKDDYVLLTTRSEKLSYYPGAYDCSAEEQLHKDDFDLDGVRIQNWVERFLEEEIGLTKENCGSSSLGRISLLSVFIEEDALNVALVVKIKLNTDKAQLEAILDNWPRKDYEFKYQLVNWEAVIEAFEQSQSETSEKKFHPTAGNRLYLAACSEMRFEMAERLKNCLQ